MCSLPLTDSSSAEVRRTFDRKKPRILTYAGLFSFCRQGKASIPFTIPDLCHASFFTIILTPKKMISAPTSTFSPRDTASGRKLLSAMPSPATADRKSSVADTNPRETHGQLQQHTEFQSLQIPFA